MSIDELETLLKLYGAEPENWPCEARPTASALLSSNPHAQRLLEQYQDDEKKLDTLLDQLADQESIPDFRALEASIMQQPLPPKSRYMTDRLLDWLLPKANHSGLPYWRPLMAACLPLLFGILLGNFYSFGVGIDFDTVDNWDDELYLLSLNDYVETAL